MKRPETFQDWVNSVPQAIRDGNLWASQHYQKALFLYELCWFDCSEWRQDVCGRAISEQIIRSCGSISANIEEGYGRGFGRDYARFLTIVVASARETQGWYLRARYLLNPNTLQHRIELCSEVIKMLVPVIQKQRAKKK